MKFCPAPYLITILDNHIHYDDMIIVDNYLNEILALVHYDDNHVDNYLNEILALVYYDDNHADNYLNEILAFVYYGSTVNNQPNKIKTALWWSMEGLLQSQNWFQSAF